MGFISINYSLDINELIYESVAIYYDKDGNGVDQMVVFSSGDWFMKLKFQLLEAPNEQYWTRSSSVDHFFFDGANYDSTYLRLDKDGKPYLEKDYIDDNCFELFIEVGENPTWEELKEKYFN